MHWKNRTYVEIAKGNEYRWEMWHRRYWLPCCGGCQPLLHIFCNSTPWPMGMIIPLSIPTSTRNSPIKMNHSDCDKSPIETLKDNSKFTWIDAFAILFDIIFTCFGNVRSRGSLGWSANISIHPDVACGLLRKPVTWLRQQTALQIHKWANKGGVERKNWLVHEQQMNYFSNPLLPSMSTSKGVPFKPVEPHSTPSVN